MCKTTYDEVKSDYHDQATKVNQAVTDYQKEYQAYLAKVAASGKDVVSSSQVVQQLTIQSEPQANLAISNVKGTLTNNEHQESISLNGGVNQMGRGYILKFSDDASFTATYTNLKNVVYQKRKISKISVDLSLSRNVNEDSVLLITDDPYYGWWFHGGQVTATYKFYYEDGSQVNFEKGTAYLAPASLNNYTNDIDAFGIETTEVVSGGQALGLYGSSVTAHGNKLYSDKANTLNSQGANIALGMNNPAPDKMVPNAKDITDSNIPRKWDTSDSPYRYYGAGLVALEGNSVTLKIYVQNSLAPTHLDKASYYTRDWNDMWYNVGTVIPETPGIPNKPTVSYNYSTVTFQNMFK
ncbi:hypothetical protein JEM51_01910 [Ligilactobacillus agilis]|uniref:GbpC/Spa domain-containing protein n=1 Tax=Ligilactobacillus agilis TaxID=1601 RepID=UPI00191DCB3C|nr:GbpC/Spa domain-containing protein [Ligilactobacillus agilis]MBL1055194.1 hypothetical protein [Ligilactobacillus agilis]